MIPAASVAISPAKIWTWALILWSTTHLGMISWTWDLTNGVRSSHGSFLSHGSNSSSHPFRTMGFWSTPIYGTPHMFFHQNRKLVGKNKLKLNTSLIKHWDFAVASKNLGFTNIWFTVADKECGSCFQKNEDFSQPTDNWKKVKISGFSQEKYAWMYRSGYMTYKPCFTRLQSYKNSLVAIVNHDQCNHY